MLVEACNIIRIHLFFVGFDCLPRGQNKCRVPYDTGTGRPGTCTRIVESVCYTRELPISSPLIVCHVRLPLVVSPLIWNHTKQTSGETTNLSLYYTVNWWSNWLVFFFLFLLGLIVLDSDSTSAVWMCRDPTTGWKLLQPCAELGQVPLPFPILNCFDFPFRSSVVI